MASAEPIEGRCAAVVKPKPEQGRPGGFCEKHPLAGQKRCRVHGAGAPQAKAAAERRIVHAQAEQAAARLGLAVVRIDPVDALLDALYRAHGMVLFIERQLAELLPEEVVWGRTRQTVADIRSGQFPGTDTTVEDTAAVHLWAQLYGEWLNQQIRAAAECRRAKIEDSLQERVQALAGDFLAKLERVLRVLGHDPMDPAVAGLVMGVLRGQPILEGAVA